MSGEADLPPSWLAGIDGWSLLAGLEPLVLDKLVGQQDHTLRWWYFSCPWGPSAALACLCCR
nr:hypothetical protein Q903MT_gene111 [Picea sitchensis]